MIKIARDRVEKACRNLLDREEKATSSARHSKSKMQKKSPA